MANQGISFLRQQTGKCKSPRAVAVGTGIVSMIEETAYRIGEIYSWSEVFKLHRTRCGIYQKDGKLISLLTDFGLINPCYPDRFNKENDNQILYTGNGRRGDQPLSPPNRALLEAIETRHAVPLFNKLAVGRWQLTGFWRVIAGEYVFDANQQRMIWQFTLEQA